MFMSVSFILAGVTEAPASFLENLK